ncbi:hypothetical protein D6853_05705 [Butyrivibrio sp. X503]|uniref:hypothetical protein n=1 Tax=Butyrivibrio sp. X503 TaxID=2364878 RepID=UPI000EAA60AA|nr:hypothetical protein [Butyrivibrio sp. X503]RKM56289.1 hypothetical protein D6853_05705 [Butyrivibrio sp. X503]
MRNKPNLFIITVLLLSVILSGCTFSSAGGADFEERYAAAKEKYDKYLQGPVSGQEVLSLIDNWDETDFEMTVEDLEGGRFCVSDIDKSNTAYKYWDEESKYYIDPGAYYEASFVIYESPRKKNDKDIEELYFSLVKE